MINQAREEHPEMSIERLCELMSVSRSWYYARPSVQQRAHKDVELRDAIERIVLEFPGYGYRRVTAELRREGWSCEPQASLEDHERGVACVPAKAPLCANHRFGPLLWELSESPQRCGTRWPLSELDLGHHLRAATHELLLAGGHLGRLLPKVRGLAPLTIHRHPSDAFGVRDGARFSPARCGADPPQ